MNAAQTPTASRRSIRCARVFFGSVLLLGLTNAYCGQAPQPKRTPPKPSTPAQAPDPTPPANPQQAQLEAQIAEQQKQQYAVLVAQQQIEDARKKKLKERPTVKWEYSIEEAQQKAASEEKPLAVYFCSEDTAALAGEGQEALDKFRARYPDDVPPPTIFDTHVVPAALKKAGIAFLVKIPYTTENKALFKRYDAQLNTIVLLAPTGDVLFDFSGTDCTVETVGKYLNEEFRLQYEEWWGKQQRRMNLQKR